MTVFRCAAVVALVLLASEASGQTPQTRAEALRLERETKRGRLTPYKHNGLETALHIVEDRLVPFLERDGLHARLGGVAAGGGTAFGIGFRDRSLARRRGSIDIWAAGSMTKYWAVEARADYPLVPGDWLSLEGYARRYEYPSEDFFGTGPDTVREDFTVFNIHGSLFGSRLDVRPWNHLSFGGGVEYQKPRVGPGTDRRFPTIGTRFDDLTAPALVSQPDYVRPWGFVEIDYRRPKNAKQGGYYRAEFSQYNDQDGGAFTFSRFDLDLRQFVIFRVDAAFGSRDGANLHVVFGSLF